MFANLVGLDPSLMAHVGYADGVNALSGTDMLTAVWPATLGYFLTQMMSNVFSPEQVDAARQYILANVIPRGPIPAFRLGQTPYGVLPVTSLQRYNQGQFNTGTIEPAIVDLVQKLSPVWLASSDSAPHMQRTGDPDKEMIGLLGMDASSMSFRGRQVFGDFFVWNYLNFLGPSPATINQWFQQHLVRGRQLLDAFGFQSMDPRVIHTGLAATSAPVPFPRCKPARYRRKIRSRRTPTWAAGSLEITFSGWCSRRWRIFRQRTTPGPSLPRCSIKSCGNRSSSITRTSRPRRKSSPGAFSFRSSRKPRFSPSRSRRQLLRHRRRH